MARINCKDYHCMVVVKSRGKTLVYCACQLTALDRVNTDVEAEEVFNAHVSDSRTLSATSDDSPA